jgi:hypothetical protein
MYEFRWNDWNIGHVAKHDVGRADAEYVVNHARSPYPRYEGDGKYVVRGQTSAGDYLQVIYIFDPRTVVYVIHARPLTDPEKKQLRRKRR